MLHYHLNHCPTPSVGPWRLLRDGNILPVQLDSRFPASSHCQTHHHLPTAIGPFEAHHPGSSGVGHSTIQRLLAREIYPEVRKCCSERCCMPRLIRTQIERTRSRSGDSFLWVSFPRCGCAVFIRIGRIGAGGHRLGEACFQPRAKLLRRVQIRPVSLVRRQLAGSC